MAAYAAKIPAVPASLKALRHYQEIAKEHDVRDPVVSFYCRRYAIEEGMRIDSKSPDARKYLMALMDCLEQMKKALATNESVHNEVVGQAHIENYGLKIFLYADNEDRGGRFNKNVVKSFYKASMIFDVLQTFGELGEDIKKNRKYARWKAAYIHDCLKKGETPHAGPLDEEQDEDEFGAAGGAPAAPTNFPSQIQPQNPSSGGGQNKLVIPPGTHAPPTTPQDPGLSQGVIPGPSQPHVPAPVSGGFHLTAEDYTKAQKFCRYASSALQYEDVPTAVENLHKALRLLQTGKE